MPLSPFRLSASISHDVAIIGYGPVGGLLANLLGRYGLSVLVLERDGAPCKLPRAVHLDDEALRILQAVGLAEPIEKGARTLASMDLVTEEGALLARVRKTGTETRPYGFATANLIHQPTVEDYLREGLTRYPTVEVRQGHAVEHIEAESEAVALIVQGPSERYRTQVGWVVGCDGARSLVRSTMESTLLPVSRSGLRLSTRAASESWLVVDVELKDDLQLEDEEEATSRILQVCSPRRPTTYVPLSGRRRRWEFRLQAGEEPETMAHPGTVLQLLASWVDPDTVSIERAAVYAFHALVASRWRQGRLLIAGDAAHQMPPFLGQGLCAGLRDAHHLAWRLALVARGAASEALLDGYEQERRPHVIAVTRLARWAGRAIGLSGWSARLRDSALRGLHHVASLRRLLTEHEHSLAHTPLAVSGTPLPRSTLLPQPWIETAEGTRVRLDTLLGDGFALLGLGISPRAWVDPADLDLWMRLTTRTVHISSPSTSRGATISGESVGHDPSGKIADYAGRSPTVLVVRPDRHLFAIYGPDEGALAAAALREALLLV